MSAWRRCARSCGGRSRPEAVPGEGLHREHGARASPQHGFGVCARILARYTGYHDDQAFLAALLHDSGIAGSLIVAEAEQPSSMACGPASMRFMRMPRPGWSPIWQLADDLKHAVACHHHCEAELRRPLFRRLSRSPNNAQRAQGVRPAEDDKQSLATDRSKLSTCSRPARSFMDDSMLTVLRAEAEDIIGSVG